MVDSAGRVLQKFEANTAPHTSRRRRDSGKVRKCAAGFNLTRVAALLIAVCPGVTVDLRGAKPLVSAPAAPRRPNALRRQIEFDHFDHGDQRMTPNDACAAIGLGWWPWCCCARQRRWSRKDWSRGFSKGLRLATRRPDRSAGYWEAQSAVSSVYSPACLASGTTRKRPPRTIPSRPARPRPPRPPRGAKGTKQPRRC